MKVILFLAAIYTLIIYEARQKKEVVLPLPAAPAAQVIKPIAQDSTGKTPAIITVGFKEKRKQQAAVLPQYSVLMYLNK